MLHITMHRQRYKLAWICTVLLKMLLYAVCFFFQPGIYNFQVTIQNGKLPRPFNFNNALNNFIPHKLLPDYYCL